MKKINKNNDSIGIITTSRPWIVQTNDSKTYLFTTRYEELIKREKEITDQIIATEVIIKEIIEGIELLEKIHIKDMIVYLEEINFEELCDHYSKFIYKYDMRCMYPILFREAIRPLINNPLRRKEGEYRIYLQKKKNNGRSYIEYNIDFKDKYHFPVELGKRLRIVKYNKKPDKNIK